MPPVYVTGKHKAAYRRYQRQWESKVRIDILVGEQAPDCARDGDTANPCKGYGAGCAGSIDPGKMPEATQRTVEILKISPKPNHQPWQQREPERCSRRGCRSFPPAR